MRDPRTSPPPVLPADGSTPAEEARGEPTLPLGAGAFASPLAWPPSPEKPATKHYRLTAIALVGVALLSAGAVSIALLLRNQRAAVAVRARSEPPSETRTQPRPPPITRRASATRTPTARSTTTPAAEKAPPDSMTGSVSAQPTLLAVRAASSKPEPARRKTRADRTLPTPSPALPNKPTRAQVIASMRKVTPAVDKCFGSTHGKATVTFSVIGKTGRVVGARVTGKAGKVGSCIARSVRLARFPKFAKTRLEISYPFAR
jgi:hypothetical protein